MRDWITEFVAGLGAELDWASSYYLIDARLWSGLEVVVGAQHRLGWAVAQFSLAAWI